MAKRMGPFCGGKLHGRDGTCTLPPGWGTDHKGYGRCRKHLGNTPTVAKAAERQTLDEQAADALARLDVSPWRTRWPSWRAWPGRRSRGKTRAPSATRMS